MKELARMDEEFERYTGKLVALAVVAIIFTAWAFPWTY